MQRQIISLNGIWKFQPSNDEAMPSAWNHTVPVPALVDLADPSHDWNQYKYHWHRRTFDVIEKSELAFIVIEQAMFGTDVWLNGEYLGGDIACYTSQEYDARPALKVRETNELIVRIGQRDNLPPLSAVGKDQERTEWIPGIWGDVYLLQCGNPRVKLVQVIPHIETATAEVRITVENLSKETILASVTSRVLEKKSNTPASKLAEVEVIVNENSTKVVTVDHKIIDMHLWSNESPFLYEVQSSITAKNKETDSLRTTFGMREFKVVGPDFYFNGKRIFLKGGNIAFHRFFSDADRGTLPWNLNWVKKLLIDIPKKHNFNFFRNHLGQMYNRWYDIADEHGMLLHNEWMFWTTTGTKAQITKEFTRWLEDNWNHPSIIMWDALNESSDEIVQKEIIPAMKKLDPTRPWESVDFVEEHPYIYSLGPVLNDRKFGFTRALGEIERSSTPTMLNEFCWWWLDKENNPSLLTKDVVERWLGPHWTKEQVVAHQSILVQELVELFRRMGVDAIQPFVYLSNNAGPTANWFVGDIKNLHPKPIIAALKNAYAPFGISLELWDRHFFIHETRTVRAFVFNDSPVRKNGTLRWGIVRANGEWISETRKDITIEASGQVILPLSVRFPASAEAFILRAELYEASSMISFSQKISHVFSLVEASPNVRMKRFAFLDSSGELQKFFNNKGIQSTHLSAADLKECSALIVMHDAVRGSKYQARVGAITKFVESGKTLILVEPEFEIEEEESVSIVLGLDMTLTKRTDTDKGGYDSYIFVDDITHPLWKEISQEHLKMFNGAYGGEAVSEHTISLNIEQKILARCGLNLAIPVVSELSIGKGHVIISRLQVRGRLATGNDPDSLYTRRVDPVVQKFILNLISYALIIEDKNKTNSDESNL